MRILYVEDEQKMVSSVKGGLEEMGIDVDCAVDGASGLEKAMSGGYDVIVSDVIMPGLTGLQLVSFLRKEAIGTPVLLLTALGATEDKVAGLEMGADDYLAKPFEFAELVARIRALARRGLDKLTHTRLIYRDIELDPSTRECRRAGLNIELTTREFDLLAYFIRHRGRAISKTEIAEQVWDLHFDTSTNVIEVYVNYLRKKVERPFGEKIIVTIFGVGYMLKAQ